MESVSKAADAARVSTAAKDLGWSLMIYSSLMPSNLSIRPETPSKPYSVVWWCWEASSLVTPHLSDAAAAIPIRVQPQKLTILQSSGQRPQRGDNWTCQSTEASAAPLEPIENPINCNRFRFNSVYHSGLPRLRAKASWRLRSRFNRNSEKSVLHSELITAAGVGATPLV